MTLERTIEPTSHLSAPRPPRGSLIPPPSSFLRGVERPCLVDDFHQDDAGLGVTGTAGDPPQRLKLSKEEKRGGGGGDGGDGRTIPALPCRNPSNLGGGLSEWSFEELSSYLARAPLQARLRHRHRGFSIAWISIR